LLTGSKTVDFNEFVKGVAKYIYTHEEVMVRYTELRSPRAGNGATPTAKHVVSTLPDIEESPEGEEEAEEEEEEEMPEDLKVMSPDEQQAAIKRRSFWMMGVGSAVVLLISDPMVDVLSELGVRTGIPAFYIAFVVAPLASNATELIAAYNYSLKKTATSITVSLTTLEGAAVMNNTFVLGVFMMLIYAKGLVWEFFAETLAILLVQIAMIFFAQKKVHTIQDAYCILALYPASLALVAILEGMGWN